MEFTAVKNMQSMPICFVQEIAISRTACAIFMEPGTILRWTGNAPLLRSRIINNHCYARKLTL